MRLSPLQKFVMRSCYLTPSRPVARGGFTKFYDNQKHQPKADDLVNIVTRSLENLIDKELMTGYGVRTSHKWYIKEVKLTSRGRKLSRKLLGEQQVLPFKLRQSKRKE